MKVLFTFYPLYVHYNHGVALLSAICRQRGIKTSLYMLDRVDNFRLHLIGTSPDYVSFSCVTAHDYGLAVPFMKEARECGITVLLGGPYPRLGKCKDAPADFICEGEGETLPEFILDGKTGLFDAPMLCADLDALPLPDYAMFQGIPFDRTNLLKGKVLPYYSSRGCPFQCSFCQIRYQPREVRIRHQVASDLSLLEALYSPDVIFIGDELLPYYDTAWRISWGDYYHPFYANIRADISEEQLLWLHDHGLIACGFGVESGNEAYRNRQLNKGLTDTDIYRTVNTLNRLGIEYAPFYMVNTPGETMAVKAQTHRMYEKLGGQPQLYDYIDLMEVAEIWAQ